MTGDRFEWSQLSHYPTLRLRYGEEMSIREIAAALGVSERTVNRRLAGERERYLAGRWPDLRRFRVVSRRVAHSGTCGELSV